MGKSEKARGYVTILSLLMGDICSKLDKPKLSSNWINLFEGFLTCSERLSNLIIKLSPRQLDGKVEGRK